MIVAAAVSTSTSASERVDVSTARTLCVSTIRTAVTINTPASAASGIWATTSVKHSTISSNTRACTTADSRVRAPARTLTAVRAIAPVAGIPPNKGDTRLASPWPNSSRLGSWRG